MEKRVLIVQCDTLMAAGLVQFLSTFENLHVEGMPIDDLGALSTVMENSRPDVLILDEECISREMGAVLPLLTLAHQPRMRALVVNHRDNSISVYEKSQVHLDQMSDFLTIL